MRQFRSGWHKVWRGLGDDVFLPGGLRDAMPLDPPAAEEESGFWKPDEEEVEEVPAGPPPAFLEASSSSRLCCSISSASDRAMACTIGQGHMLIYLLFHYACHDCIAFRPVSQSRPSLITFPAFQNLHHPSTPHFQGPLHTCCSSASSPSVRVLSCGAGAGWEATEIAHEYI